MFYICFFLLLYWKKKEQNKLETSFDDVILSVCEQPDKQTARVVMGKTITVSLFFQRKKYQCIIVRIYYVE